MLSARGPETPHSGPRNGSPCVPGLRSGPRNSSGARIRAGGRIRPGSGARLPPVYRRRPDSPAAHDAPTSGTMVTERHNGHQRGGNLASTRRPAVRKVRTKQLNSYLGVRAQRIHLL